MWAVVGGVGFGGIERVRRVVLCVATLVAWFLCGARSRTWRRCATCGALSVGCAAAMFCARCRRSCGSGSMRAGSPVGRPEGVVDGPGGRREALARPRPAGPLFRSQSALTAPCCDRVQGEALGERAFVADVVGLAPALFRMTPLEDDAPPLRCFAEYPRP